MAQFALILQKLGEWYENLPLVPVTRALYRIISVHALKCVPKAMHSSMCCDAQCARIDDMLSLTILTQNSLNTWRTTWF